MKHVSKHIRPGAQVLEVNHTDGDLMATAAENEDGSIVVVVFNEGEQPRSFDLNIDGTERLISIDAQALQTIVIEPKH
jgi:glucosylceramidase